MVFKLLTSRWTWTFLILILLISLIVFMFNSKHLVDNFTDLDLSCYAIQNKYYNIDELLYKSRCPNLVILEKLINGRTAFLPNKVTIMVPIIVKIIQDIIIWVFRQMV